MKIISFLFVGFCGLLTPGRGQDPCNERRIIRDQYQRSLNYSTDTANGESHICDRYNDEGWYEFQSGSGNEMPTVQASILDCGTEFPIWLNGPHPGEQDGIVDRIGCMTGLSSFCSTEYPIKIKNCGGYYVYYLVPTDGCAQAYCVGKEVKCNDGESSENGYTPGCVKDGFPVFHNEPDITYGIEEIKLDTGVTRRAVVMLCSIAHHETDITVDVYWYMDKTLVKENVGENGILYKDFPAKLHEDDWKDKATLDSHLSCKLRPRYEANSVPGEEKQVSFYMGMVVEETILVVEEGGDPTMYRFYPTIPILCPIELPDCVLIVEVHEPYIEGEVATCPDGRRQKQLGVEFQTSNCTIGIEQIEVPDPTKPIEFPIYAGNDQTYDNDAVVFLVLRTVTQHEAHEIWQNYNFPTAQVTVIEKDEEVGNAKCIAANDPHMTSFDGRRFDNMREGEFIMYRHHNLPIEVQAFFKARGSYSSVCGAAVRSGGDLWIYDYCREGYSKRIRAYECDDMTLHIEQTGTDYKVYLPTGGHVLITDTRIEIVPSLDDIEQTEGLCGFFDHDCSNDFKRRDGTIVPGSDFACNDDHEDDFNKQWIVEDSESLYEGEIREEEPFDEYYFCSCTKNDNTGEYETICSKSLGLDYCVATDDDVTDEFFEWCTDINRKKRSVSAYGDDVEEPVQRPEWDENFNPSEPEWPSGNWTEESATQYCQDYLLSNSVIQTCIGMVEMPIDSALAQCVQDIKITSDVAFSEVHLSNLLASCQYEVGRNNSKYTLNNETGTPSLEPPVELEQMCPNDCYGQGTCVEGKCHCNAGYFGDDCYYDENKVPVLFDMQFDGLCDLQTRPCTTTPVYGDYFLRKPTLSCKITPVILTKTGDKLQQDTIVTIARYSHVQRIMCPFPVVSIMYDEVDYFTIGYDISASNDRVHFSDFKQLAVYDSKCMNCTSELNCVQSANTCVFGGLCYNNGEAPDPVKACYVCDGQNGFAVEPGSCYIASDCYASGDANPDDNCYYCNPDTNNIGWTHDTKEECNPSNNVVVIAGGAVLLVCLVSTAIGGAFIYRHNKVHPKKKQDDTVLENIDGQDLPKATTLAVHHT